MRFKENPFCHEQKIFKTTNRGFQQKHQRERHRTSPIGALAAWTFDGLYQKNNQAPTNRGFVTLGYSTKTGVVMGPWNDNQRQALLRLALVRIPRSPRGKVPLLNAVVGSG